MNEKPVSPQRQDASTSPNVFTRTQTSRPFPIALVHEDHKTPHCIMGSLLGKGGNRREQNKGLGTVELRYHLLAKLLPSVHHFFFNVQMRTQKVSCNKFRGKCSILKIAQGFHESFCNLNATYLFHEPDINECEERSYSCHVNASCSNTIGSYKCICFSGLKGDGLHQCSGIRSI